MFVEAVRVLVEGVRIIGGRGLRIIVGRGLRRLAKAVRVTVEAVRVL